MKTRIICVALLCICMSCMKNNAPVSPAEAEKIQAEVKLVIADMNKAIEESNLNALMKLNLDTTQIMSANKDKFLSSEQWKKGAGDFFNSLKNQKITIIDEKFTVLDKTTVIYASIIRCEENFKNGSVIMQYPWNVHMLFKKSGDTWKVADGTEWGHEEIIKSGTSETALNQQELALKFVGKWQVVSGDTVTVIEQKVYGKGQEAFAKTKLKGKDLAEAKQLFGYDKRYDAIVYYALPTLGSSEGYTCRFESPTKYKWVPYINISDPSLAPRSWEGEFISPDQFVEKEMANGKLKQTYTYTRLK